MTSHRFDTSPSVSCVCHSHRPAAQAFDVCCPVFKSVHQLSVISHHVLLFVFRWWLWWTLFLFFFLNIYTFMQISPFFISAFFFFFSFHSVRFFTLLASAFYFLWVNLLWRGIKMFLTELPGHSSAQLLIIRSATVHVFFTCPLICWTHLQWITGWFMWRSLCMHGAEIFVFHWLWELTDTYLCVGPLSCTV